MNIRPECFRPGEDWLRPNGHEIREVLALAGLSGSQAARILGLGHQGGRTVRRWTGDDSPIPFAAWAILCDLAGLGAIWRESPHA
ncbi:transcriptional regulator [Shinella yambaruensis]|uniref:Transcriptional regulator n=1 Tax=Shinella yambaruensis TaxID=415996 RepID=A0ABQ5ZTX2_9HYPH|nr:transcriptional regulator [Shinella yambaruensis]MCU7984205.1 transcriptional regulator [Shinella yambaruensis]GLR55201.1 hypothetical protein GCM10007923_64230 [Shinella yambaruensis]